MVSTPEGLKDNSPMDVGGLVALKNLCARKSLSRFLVLLILKQKLMFTKCVLIKQSTRQYGKALIYGLVLISRGGIQKSMQVLKSPL